MLKLQSIFPSRIGQRCHSTVVFIVTAIEPHALDAGGLCLLGNRAPDLLGRITITGGIHTVSMRFIPGARRSNRATGLVVDQLTIDMLVAAKDTQSGYFRATAKLVSHVVTTASLPNLLSFCLIHRSRSLIPID